jgi:NAD(P)H-hydrate epimerase
MVDMVFYSSVPSNNELIQNAKEHFHNGIVIPRENLDDYIQEADVVLIGPGMERTQETEQITDRLLQKYPDKKWVIDAGALQMLDPSLLNERMIITPHHKEYEGVMKKGQHSDTSEYDFPATCLLKGDIDKVLTSTHSAEISGGNVGMTKGGTGDVLAGLVAGLYAFTDDPFAAAVVGSYINKKAGDTLFETVGPFFNSTDLANQIPYTLKETFDL